MANTKASKKANLDKALMIVDEVRETRVVIKDHTETHCNGHYELWELATDKWVKVTPKEYSETMRGMINKDRFQTQICGCFLDPKWVADGPDIKDTKKVVYIGY